jgi:hypothetical protein
LGNTGRLLFAWQYTLGLSKEQIIPRRAERFSGFREKNIFIDLVTMLNEVGRN